MRMLASQENVSDSELLGVAGAMLSLGTETLAPNSTTNTFKPLPFKCVHIAEANKKSSGPNG